MEYTCKRCNQTLQAYALNTRYIVCKSCHKINERNPSNEVYIDFANPMPNDLSLLQIGTELNHEKKKYVAIGRYRHHLKNSYLNHWLFLNGETDELHIFEQLGNYVVAKKSETKLNAQQLNNLRSGAKINLNTITEPLYIESVDKNCMTHFLGEIEELNLTSSNFFYINLSNNFGDAAIVFIYNDKNHQIFTGKYGSFKDFQFSKTNLITI